MNPVVTTPTESLVLPPVPRVERITMGSFEVPEAVAGEDVSKYLPREDGVPLETAWHRYAMNLMIEVLNYLWRARNDFYVGGNMFIYYSYRRLRNVDFIG